MAVRALGRADNYWLVFSAEAGDLERASGFFKAEARQLRLPLKSAVMKALGKDGDLDEVIIDDYV